MDKKKTLKVKEISDIMRLDNSVKTPSLDYFQKEAKKGNDINKFENIKRPIKKKNSFRKIEPSKYIKFKEKKIFAKVMPIQYRSIIIFENKLTSEDYMKKKEEMEATKIFFGLGFELEQQLLFKIACNDYQVGETIISDPRTREREIFDITKNYQDWKDYCHNVDQIKPYIELTYKNRDKKQSKIRDLLYDSSKLFPNSIIEFISDYYHKYGLHQSKQAKTDALLNLYPLPHICTKEIALKIVNMYITSQK